MISMPDAPIGPPKHSNSTGRTLDGAPTQRQAETNDWYCEERDSELPAASAEPANGVTQ
jgi:hypothetical protein